MVDDELVAIVVFVLRTLAAFKVEVETVKVNGANRLARTPRLGGDIYDIGQCCC